MSTFSVTRVAVLALLVILDYSSACADSTCQDVGVFCGGNCTYCSQEDCSPLLDVPERTCHEKLEENVCSDQDNPHCGAPSSCEEGKEWKGELSYTFKYKNADYSYIELEWNQDADIEFYTLILSNHEPWSNSRDCTRHICITQLSQNETTFRHEVSYGGDDSTFETVYVMLIPAGWCDGVRLSIPAPLDCFRVCPGMCSSHCQRFDPAGPRNISTSAEHVDNSTVAISMSWEPGEVYYGHHPLSLLRYLIKIYDSTGTDITGNIAVTEKRNVTLQLSGLVPSNVYKIKVTEIFCFPSLYDSAEASLIIPTFPPQPTPTTSENLMSSSPHPSSLQLLPSLPSHVTISSHTPPVMVTVASMLLPSASPISPLATAGLRSTTPLTYLTPIIVFLSIVLLVLTVILIITRRQAKFQKRKVAPPSSPKPSAMKRVLVLYSQISSKYDQECVLENVVKALSDYKVDSVYFDGPCLRGSVADYLATNVKCCDKVLVVCNKQFAMEWTRQTANSLHGQSLVYVLRQLIDSYVKNDKKVLEKFAILYLRRKDQNCLENPYLKNMKSFLVNPQDVTQLEHIVRFIYDTPTYTLA